MRRRSSSSSVPTSSAIDISEAGGVRFLHFGSEWVQGAMRINRPWGLELTYTKEMMAGLLLRPRSEWPKKILMIGLGAGSLARYAYRYLPESKITVVEINPQVEWIAREYFKLPDDPKRLRVIIADGIDYVLSAPGEFDCILLDGFDAEASPGALDSEPFYQACRACMSEKGWLASNLFGTERGFPTSVERVRKAFDQRALILPPSESGNAIAFGFTGTTIETTLAEMQTQADYLANEMQLNLQPTLDRLQQIGLTAEVKLTL